MRPESDGGRAEVEEEAGGHCEPSGREAVRDVREGRWTTQVLRQVPCDMVLFEGVSECVKLWVSRGVASLILRPEEDWKNHKPTCQPFCAGSTITLIPCYSDEITSLASWSDMARERLGQPFDKRPARNSRSVHIPRISPGQTKQMIIKVQVPMDVEAGLPSDKHVGNLLVYDKKRSLVCRIRKCDNVEGYMRLSETVLTQGVMGAKAYLSAEMTSPDALVVKVSEVLAEQAF